MRFTFLRKISLHLLCAQIYICCIYIAVMLWNNFEQITFFQRVNNFIITAVFQRCNNVIIMHLYNVLYVLNKSLSYFHHTMKFSRVQTKVTNHKISKCCGVITLTNNLRLTNHTIFAVIDCPIVYLNIIIHSANLTTLFLTLTL